MIEIKDLKPEDVGRIVVYKSGPNGKNEKGKITSWNESYIFVDYYGTDRGTATRPINLTWDKDDVLLNNLEKELNKEDEPALDDDCNYAL